MAILKIGDSEFPISDLVSAVIHTRASLNIRASHTPHTDQQHPEQIVRSRPEAGLAVEQSSDPTAGRTFRSEFSVWRRPWFYESRVGSYRTCS